MQLNFTLNNLASFAGPVYTFSSRSLVQPPASLPSGQQEQQELTRSRVGTLRASLAEVDELLKDAPVVRQPGRAFAYSSMDLGLMSNPTATTLSSSEEINTAATSYSTFGPAFAGSSTALPTLDGVYDGSNGSDTLTFKVKKGGTHGQDNLSVEVRDSSGTKLDTLDISKNDAIDQEYVLGNGIVFTLGEGTLKKNETFDLTISDVIGSAVNPDKSFDGIRDDRPNFEYGSSVTAGTFDVNGITIDVAADDTITSVLDQINQSAAGVNATFDSATESINLTQTQNGSAFDIVLGNDTSGFLVATKLDNATSVAGTDEDAASPLQLVAQFAGVQSGTLSINGTQIAFDVQSDSLNDIIERINAAESGASASLQSSGQRMLLKSDLTGASMTLDDGGTGLLAALAVDAGEYRAPKTNAGVSAEYAERISAAIERATKALNQLTSNRGVQTDGDVSLERLRRDLRYALDASAEPGSGNDVQTSFGINFNRANANGQSRDFVTVDFDVLQRALRRNIGDAQNFFNGQPSGGRLGFNTYVQEALAKYSDGTGSLGLLVNTFA